MRPKEFIRYNELMYLVQFKRIIKSAWLSFRRNGLLSTAAVAIMSLTLFVIGGLLLLSVVANTILAELENKIDISVYFVPGSSEEAILKIKGDVAASPNVKSVNYVSQEEALLAFKDRHKDDPVIAASLTEFDGGNPFGATLNIKARSPAELASVAEFLAGRKYGIVDKINYFENETVIERLSSVVAGVRSVGLLLVLVLSFVAVLVAFNTVRLAIYTARDEIQIMKAVGASNWFVRGPFIVTGVIHGALSAFATSFALLPVVWAASPKVSFFMPKIDLFGYFISNFFEFLLIMTAIGVSLGVFSSVIAVRKYLSI